MRTMWLFALAACGSGTTSPDGGNPSNPVAGAWWRCDGESPDCSHLLYEGLLLRDDGTFAVIRGASSTNDPTQPLCTTTSNNDRGTYAIDVAASTIDTLNDYGVDSGPVGYTFVAAGTYPHVLRFDGGRRLIPISAAPVGGDCM